MWHGFRWWQGMDVDPSTKEIIPNTNMSRAEIKMYKWALVLDYYTNVMVEMVWAEPSNTNKIKLSHLSCQKQTQSFLWV